ncbi:hypothetical protein D8B23_16360 [Verminephrobacter aporrectodeae subsp. tuberculatae]|uniref:hypothetical protein n=1 Tax=Verminephrobacter aporrectodeae TaxID=1110389 RepID=UPI0002376886|nr:hypothetical protein [Verminephrobacter aporrectodeae]MCW5222276.1 hypothetical protein [Verminephrobacter aporrectodeae subsp. tuberculatae]MCW5287740.1 hypothetical protein [Verminephrobacter aporrectodeae subsp. tuberculatae]MCW8165451.1 hypothetical protein [Verminephrobacter aporrectodeae subsp. tuberculatae]MCW8170019.1 hypothetical protein [Verminephrobacter aporrectodeae subsp. tuberculatae]MCW8176833.1 hypothetical protein [Verminephrobacter aporrectodeae subsp. tuberculatae]
MTTLGLAIANAGTIAFWYGRTTLASANRPGQGWVADAARPVMGELSQGPKTQTAAQKPLCALHSNMDT